MSAARLEIERRMMAIEETLLPNGEEYQDLLAEVVEAFAAYFHRLDVQGRKAPPTRKTLLRRASAA